MSSDEFDPFEAFENAPWRPVREMLANRGFVSPDPAGLESDRELRGRLWELIHALAGLRFFFHATDHLSDREFYHWFHEEWLDELHDDIPPEAEFNCHTDLADAQTDEGAAIWLRYHASPSDRQDWARDFPDFKIPPHEWPPHDRDRFLPTPYPPAFREDEDDHDPLGLAAVDREIRGEVLPPPRLREKWERPLETFSRDGFSPLPPDEITDEAMPAYLWELLHELSCRGFYVQNSGHLSDRELYSDLWRSGIREEAILPGKSPRGGWFHDCTGSGSDEHTRLWLRFHASAEARERHARDSPADPLPPRETPPHPRDWRLPKGPF
jgi:hypothetical protein